MGMDLLSTPKRATYCPYSIQGTQVLDVQAPNCSKVFGLGPRLTIFQSLRAMVFIPEVILTFLSGFNSSSDLNSTTDWIDQGEFVDQV